jgi:hypothetical protein
LSSDGSRLHHVNGVCSCQAGQHGKACKHIQAWKLYRYIAGKVAERKPDQGDNYHLETPPQHHEAPASVNLKVLLHGHEVMVTLRDSDEAILLSRLQVLLTRPDIRPVPGRPAARTGAWRKGH